jgi:hypothetical protein
VANWLESLKRQILGDDRTVTWEGSTGMMQLSGAPSVERLLDDTVRLCKGAIDRSTRSLIDKERLQPAANRLEVQLFVSGHDRAIRTQDAIDGMDLHDDLSHALTDYAVNQQQYLVWGGRVRVPPITVEERSESDVDRIQVRWKKDREAVQPATPRSPGVRTSREERAAANRPADPSVLSSGRKTVHSGEGISQPFTLWVKDREGDPVAHPVMTPFYFGRNTRGLQIDADMTDEELISGEHFSILYLPDLGYVLRDNKSTNGTMVIREEEAVRLVTPAAKRETELAKEMRLKEGDVIRLERGSPSNRGAIQFAFALDDASPESLLWADNLSLRHIQWRDARELIAQRLAENAGTAAPPEEYTLMIGESYLGSSVTGSIWVAYQDEDENFRDGQALALITNMSRCSLTWLRPEIPASLNGRPLNSLEPVAVPSGGMLEYGSVSRNGASEAPPTRVRFQWIEDHGRSPS